MLEHTPRILGEVLKDVRPGLDKLASAAFADVPDTVVVESPAFADGGAIPADHTADGRGLSPPLRWRNLPDATAAVALLVEDADSPTPQPLVHAIVPDLPGADGALAAGALAGPAGPGGPHALGKNSFLKAEYLPPDPPTGHGPHRYAFQVFALREALPLGAGPGRGALIEALQGRALAKGLLIGTYERA